MASKSAEKIASGTRTAIRRNGTPRGRSSNETRRRRLVGMIAATNATGDYEVWENQQSRTPPINPDVTSVASLQARAHRIFEEERTRLRDTLSFERQHPPNTEQDGSSMPPAVPEPRDYSGSGDHQRDHQREMQRLRQMRQDLRRMSRRLPAPTPPYTETDIAFTNRPGSDAPSSPPLMSRARYLPTPETFASTSTPQPLEDEEDSTYREFAYFDVSVDNLSLVARTLAVLPSPTNCWHFLLLDCMAIDCWVNGGVRSIHIVNIPINKYANL